MILKNKKLLILTSLLTLLPILVGLVLWNKLPEKFATHWGMDGLADGYSSLPFAVFAPPLIILAVQWLCVWITTKDPGNKDRNHKPLSMVLWIIPVISNLCCGLMYALALGVDLSITHVMVAALGLLFVIIGNYLPKCKMNSTLGIKVSWTYTSEENWNATHRFGGKTWVIGGLLIMLSALLPGEFSIYVMLISIFVLVFIPVIYSYRYYLKQKANGDALAPFPKAVTRGGKWAWIPPVAILLIAVCFLFVGEIDYVFEDDCFIIDADLYHDLTVEYDVIESLEYRDGNVSGARVGGFGSFQLLMGYFENEEFGVYTRYTYYKPEACIVLTADGKTLVISGETAAETQAVYQELLSRIK